MKISKAAFEQLFILQDPHLVFDEINDFVNKLHPELNREQRKKINESAKAFAIAVRNYIQPLNIYKIKGDTNG